MSQKKSQMCRSGHQIFSDSCSDCLNLKAEWYSVLESENFHDIENNGYLKTTQYSDYIRVDFQTKNQFDARYSYYQWAQEKANDGRFDSSKDRLIWQFHSEGKATRWIGEQLGHTHSWIVKKKNRIKDYLKDQADTIGTVCYSQSIA